jgi:hypothetical protein
VLPCSYGAAGSCGLPAYDGFVKFPILDLIRGYLDKLTQKNMAMVEETNTAAKTVEEQIQNVNALLGFFQLRAAR